MIITILLTILMLSCSAFFSASETAIFSIPREKHRELAQGSPRDKHIFTLLSKGEETLILILLGNLFVNITAISLLSAIFAQLEIRSVALSLFLITTILLTFGEIMPKNIAIQHNMPIARLSAGILCKLSTVFSPLIGVFKKLNRSLLRWNYHYLLQSPTPYITPEEYRHALDDSVEKGEITQESATCVNSYLTLAENQISKIAIHRSRLSQIREGISYSLKYDQGHEIIAVGIHDGDHYSEEEADWFPMSQDLGTLHHFLLKQGRQTVLLSDEYGELYGIATRKELYRYWQHSVLPQKYEHQEIELEGSRPLIEVRSWFPETLMDAFTESKTVNGLMTSWLERIPEEGEIQHYESTIFTFITVEPNRIVRLKIQKEHPNA